MFDYTLLSTLNGNVYANSDGTGMGFFFLYLLQLCFDGDYAGLSGSELQICSMPQFFPV